MTLPLKIFKMTYSQGKDLIKLYYFSIMTGVLHQAWHYVSWKRGAVRRGWQRWWSLSLSQFLLSIQRFHSQCFFSLYCSSMTKGKCLHNIGIKIVLSSLVIWKCCQSYEFQRTSLESHFIETSGIYWEPPNPSAPLLSLGVDSTEQLLSNG